MNSTRTTRIAHPDEPLREPDGVSDDEEQTFFFWLGDDEDQEGEDD